MAATTKRKRTRRRKKKNQQVRFSKVIVAAVLVSVVAFTVTMTIIYCIKGGVPDSLVTAFFAFAGGEAGVLGLIKHGETKYTDNGSANDTSGSDDSAAG